MGDERWTKRILECGPYNKARPMGRPPELWDDDVQFMTRGQQGTKNWQQMEKKRFACW